MSRLVIIVGLVLSACAATSSTTIPADEPSVTSTTSTTTTIAPGQTDPSLDRQSGIQFTELLTLDRIGRGDAAPVAILVHGGGWYGGDRSSTEPLAQLLADQGFVAINATYRTAGGGFPQTVEDVVCATIAGRTIAAEAGGTGPVILIGHSAGAHLAALAALAGDEFEPRDCLYDGSWEPLDGFVGLAGPYKIQNLFGIVDAWMGVTYEEDPELWARALPENYVERHIETPVRLIHGDADRLTNVSFSELFAAELAAVPGRDIELVIVPEAGHSTILAPLMDADVTVSVIDDLVDALSTDT